MVTVFFEYGAYTEIVATFKTEELYMACLKSLERYAKKNRAVLTESISQ